MLKAGTAKIDISPGRNINLAGYPHCPRHNTGIHDPLYACSLYLSDGGNEIVIISLDLLSIAKKLVAEIRGMFKQKLMFVCSHTHSGPWTSEPLASEREEGITCNPDYMAQLKQKLITVINQAIDGSFDAKAGTAIGRCGGEQGVGGNRRTKGGIADPSVNVLAVKDMTDNTRAVLVNYTLHPTYLHAESTLVTADYPCYMRRYFSYAQPDAVFLFAQGTSGDQSSRYHRTAQDFEEAARAGTTIAVEANRALLEIQFSSDFKIGVNSFEIDDLPFKTYPSVEEAEKLKIQAEKEYEDAKTKDYITARNAELKMFGAQNNYYYSKMTGYKSPELPMEVMFASLGDTLIVTLQGELFVEIGLRIKQLSGYKKTFVFSVSNGYLPGYIYTKEAGETGGYEIGTSMFTDDTEAVLIKSIEKFLKKA